MQRFRRHDDHDNHEAWAIPYGDLVTLLLAFFVVMYAMSSVNEGKYRVLSDSLTEAFHGTPRSPQPIEAGARRQILVVQHDGDRAVYGRGGDGRRGGARENSGNGHGGFPISPRPIAGQGDVYQEELTATQVDPLEM